MRTCQADDSPQEGLAEQLPGGAERWQPFADVQDRIVVRCCWGLA